MTTATATRASAEISAARERNEAIWKRMSSLYYAKRVDEALANWHEDARWEAVYPVKGLPALVEGRAALTEMFAGVVALAHRIQVHDVRFHQTDDPEVAFIEERMVLELVDGGRYDNRIAMRVTFREGLIAEMLEYSGPHETEELLRRLGVAAEA
jgi:ketosteroid isomerase-like protein